MSLVLTYTHCCCCCRQVASIVSDSVRPHRRQPNKAPPSLGFSRQEHRSGLPFPSPRHEGEKWKWSCSVVSNSQQPHGLQHTRLLHPWDFPGKSTGVGCHCLFLYIHYYIHIINCTAQGPILNILTYNGKESEKEFVCTTESLFCILETNTTL